MENAFHSLESLFAQLGLPSDTASINAFISAQRPLAGHLALHQADCWNEAQRTFLRDDVNEDADWAAIVDHLNVLMR